jgi:hypothetical protein
MTEHLKQGYAADIKIRTEGAEGLSKQGLAVNVHEISAAGPVYRDANVTVRAISVPHGSWPQAFGYAIDAAGRSIVISGDPALSEAIAEACQGCDVLVHEVYSAIASISSSGRAAAGIIRPFTLDAATGRAGFEIEAQTARVVSPALFRPRMQSI